jgi:RecJ-like exonuclease
MENTKCSACDGRGYRLLVAVPGRKTCEPCHGTGRVLAEEPPPDPRLRHQPEIKLKKDGAPVDPRLRHQRGKDDPIPG